MSYRGRTPLVTFSQTEFVYDGEEVLCWCKNLAPRQTAWTNDNPGRRFYGCANYRGGGCGFFKWYDKAMPKRAKEILLALRDSERSLAKENEKLRRQLEDLGLGADEYESTGISKKESGEEINSLQSGVLEQTTKKEVVEDDELLQQFIKTTYEMDSLRHKNQKLVQKSCNYKKGKQFYKLISILLLGCCLALLLNGKSSSNGSCFLSLP